MVFELPYPPSVNNYWRHSYNNKCVYISKEGQVYRQNVIGSLANTQRLEGRLKLFVTLHPPDKRKRDLDNPLKCLLDALQHSGVIFDDNQFDALYIERGEVSEKGKAIVEIIEIKEE